MRRTLALLGGLLAAFLAGLTPAQEINLAGLQVWNVGYWQTVSLGDFMGPNYEIRTFQPIVMAGCRGGSFSGCIVATCSTAPIEGLKVSINELTAEGGKKIPASHVRIRYPELARVDTSWAPPYRFDRILDEAPEEVKMVDMRQHRDWKPKKAGPVAMQPIWVTVDVPTNAVPGQYEAKMTVECDNNKPYTVMVKMTVHDWLLPNPRDYLMRNMGWLCPERTAIYYDLPMWGEKHLEYCGKSLEMMLPLGSRHVEANLVVRYLSRDNREVMVKWIKQPDGTFKYDFSVFDKYMDVVARTIGKPNVVRLNMWSSNRKPCHAVVVVDPTTGKTEELEQPLYGTEASYAFWKPVFDEIRVRMDKRGWSDVTAPNWHEYCGGPDTNTVSMFKRIWPDGKWVDMDHGIRTGFGGVKKEDWTPVLTSTTVWGEHAMRPRGYIDQFFRTGPKQRYCCHARGRHREWSTLWNVRAVPEETILKGFDGVDPLGGDLWMIPDERGRWISGAWSACALGPGNCTRAFLGPGPNGPVTTERYEAFREGVQICEATLYIQRGINTGKLSPELATRANQALDERGKRRIDSWVLADKSGRMNFDEPKASTGGLESESELYAVAAAVAQALK